MVRKVCLIGATAMMMLSSTALAQTQGVTVIRETLPVQSTVIVANSPQDIALQEEIRKIRAYNAYVDSQVGVSETYKVIESVQAEVNPYSNVKIELFETPVASTQAAFIEAPTSVSFERRPVSGVSAIYRISQGDTLYGLARANCISVVDIQNTNELSGQNIQIGQTITMPASQCMSNFATAQTLITSNDGFVRKVMPVPSSITVGTSNNYAVLPKDTLYSIGRRYCLSANEIASHNTININKAIQPGQVLRLPDSACSK